MLKRMKQSRIAFAGLIIVLVFVGIAVCAPLLAPPHGDPFSIPQDQELLILQPNPTPPTYRHIFGTTDQQYDLYYACIWGSITAFRTGLLVVAFSLVVGLLVGTIAAMYGGLLDEALMRLTDIVIAFPGLILAMALVIAFPSVLSINLSLVLLLVFVVASFLLLAFHFDKKVIMIVQLLMLLSLISTLFYPLGLGITLSRLDKVLLSIALVGWPGYTRVIRGEVLRVKNEDYVEASRASGSSDFRLIVKHIWPNTIYPILIVATLDIGSIVLSAAALSFIGLGADPNFADWGQVIQRSRNWISNIDLIVANFHAFAIPGLFITFFVMGWNLLGDALRDVLDPMLRRR
jgi:peptide/nickel transport system permease protein